MLWSPRGGGNRFRDGVSSRMWREPGIPLIKKEFPCLDRVCRTSSPGNGRAVPRGAPPALAAAP
jgi:hypothetical protein